MPGQAWIGGFKTVRGQGAASEWHWITGEPWSFTSWNHGEPNNVWDGKNVFLTIWDPAEGWNDEQQGFPLRQYVVEFPVGQTVASSQSETDPQQPRSNGGTGRNRGLGRGNVGQSTNANVSTSRTRTSTSETPSKVKRIEGDWTITGEQSFDDTILEVDGRIIITKSGSLRLENSWLVFGLSGPDSVMEVQGGELSLDQSQLRLRDFEAGNAEYNVVVSASGGRISFERTIAPHGLALEALGARVVIADSSIDVRGSSVSVYGGELVLKDSEVSRIDLHETRSEIANSVVEIVEFSPPSELDLRNSVLSAFSLVLPPGGDFLVSRFGRSGGGSPSILDLQRNEAAKLTLDGSSIRNWDLNIEGGSVTIEDSQVGNLLSQTGSRVALNRSEVGNWDARDIGRATNSVVKFLYLSSHSGTSIRLTLEDTVIGTIHTPDPSPGRMVEARITCRDCRIDDSIVLRNANVLLEGDVMMLVPESNVIWENSQVKRLFPVIVTNDQGDPLTGVPLGTTVGGDFNLVADGDGDGSGTAVLELHFFDSDWSRTEMVTTALGTVEVQERLTFLSSTPVVLSVPRSSLAGFAGEDGQFGQQDDGQVAQQADHGGFIDCMVTVLGEERVYAIFANRARASNEDMGSIEGECFGYLFPPEKESVIAVMAQIDGRSQLAIRGDSVQWFHFDDAAPGREGSSVLSTFINGIEWIPGWPDQLSTENRDCECASSIFEGLDPALADDQVGVELEILRARGEVSIVETPSVDNGFTLVIEFTDPQGGPDWYEVRINHQSQVTTASAITPTVVQRNGTGMTRGATISGRVVSKDTGFPLANIHMVADPTTEGPSADGDTDADGRYTLIGLPSGTYKVRAEGHDQGYVRTFYPDQFDRGNADYITVADSEAIEGIDFDLELGATLTGRVTDADTGLPIADLGLRARPPRGNELSWAGTNTNGRYILKGLPGGLLVEVKIEGEGYVQARAQILIGDAGVTQSADFTLTRGTTISGRVFDVDTGLPIANVDVDADNTSRSGPNSYARTDALGNYTLRGVAPGTYRIEVRNTRSYIREYYDDRLGWDNADFISIQGESPITGIDFALKLGMSISGQVIDDDTGLPMANVEIDADRIEGSASRIYGRTGSDGRYTLVGVGPGNYRVKAGRNLESYVQEYYDDQLTWDGANFVSVGGTSPVDGVNFALRKGATIFGTVLDAETGLPISGLDISARIVDGDDVSGANTNREGNFVLRGLPPSLIEVRVRGEEFIEQRSVVRVGEFGATDRQDFSLQRGATITGVVIDAETGLPIADVKIDADDYRGRNHIYAETGLNGVYTLRGVAPGNYVIRVGRDNETYVQTHYYDSLSSDQAEPVTVSGTETLEGIDFALKVGGTISGRVVDGSTGLPIANMDVGAGPEGQGQLSWTRTDRDGNYTLRGIPAGLIAVWISGQGYLGVGDTVQVADGENITGFDF